MSAKVKEFRPNTRYVFSKSRFIKDMGIKTYYNSKTWVNEADGKEIESYGKYICIMTGRISTKNHPDGFYEIPPSWCKVIR